MNNFVGLNVLHLGWRRFPRLLSAAEVSSRQYAKITSAQDLEALLFVFVVKRQNTGAAAIHLHPLAPRLAFCFTLNPYSMPFFESTSNVQIIDGSFVDIRGNLNLHISQPALRQDDSVEMLEVASSEGNGRQLAGVERNSRQAAAARMLPYDLARRPQIRALHSSAEPYSHVHKDHSWPMPVESVSNPPLLPLLQWERESNFPSFEPVSNASSERDTPISQADPANCDRDFINRTHSHCRLWADARGYQYPPSGLLHVAASSVLAGLSAGMLSESETMLAPRQRNMITDECQPQTLPAPSIDLQNPPLGVNYTSSNYLRSDGTPPFPGDFRNEGFSARIINEPPRGAPCRRRTSINIGGNMNNIQRRGESGFHILHRTIAGDAFYDAAERCPQPKCHPETRTEMLEDLYKWSNFGTGILWLHGPAGAGKTAIAQSFCQTLEEEGRLGAGFFFKRGHLSRGSGIKLFPTIAYQLGRSRPNLKQVISGIMEDDPSIVDRDLSTQALKLIIEPCVRCGIRPCNLAIVIDGLDECEGQHIQREILCSLGMVFRKHPRPFRVLVASRPEPHIHEIFQDVLHRIHRPVNINQSFVAVQRYLIDEFRRIHQEHRETMALVPKPWPCSNVIDDLVEKSSGYFVYASTVIKFVDDKDFRPTERLAIIIGIKEPASEAPFVGLDELYNQILSTVPIPSRPQLLEVLTVIAAKFKLSVLHIEQLIGLCPGDVCLILRHLHSVLDVPQNTGERITVHHASFLDFLNDRSRSGAFHTGDLQGENLAHRIFGALSLRGDASSDHVAWQLVQQLQYVMSVKPSSSLLCLLYSFNTNFLVFPNARHIVRLVLTWLKKSQPLPLDLIQSWEDYQFIISDFRLNRKFLSQSPSSTQLVKFVLLKVRQLVNVPDLHSLGCYRDTMPTENEAATLYHSLADKDPSFISDLAISFYSFSMHLLAVGRPEDAVKFDGEINFLRKLAETDPTVTKDLAKTLHNLGVDLTDMGRHEDALRAGEEAVKLRRKLTETNELATSLHRLGHNLCAVGRYQDAVQAHKEEAQLRRKLAETDPAVTRDLATSLHSLGYSLRIIGQHQAAVTADAEAVELFCQVAKNDSSVNDDLAGSLENLGLNLNAVGRHEDAARAAEEAVQHYAELPDIIEPEPRLANILVQRATYLRALGRQEDAVYMHEKGAELHRKLSETEPESAAELLRELAEDFSTTGLHEDALSAAEKATGLYRNLTPTKPTLTKELIESLQYVAKILRALGREEDAVRAEVEVATLKGAQPQSKEEQTIEYVAKGVIMECRD
ncbi:hypothetical protein DFH06DRAFT_1079273 [Mycena polygramma]|nr:hypothetical protein DFH06DRAFT_1079273 [Mycena polygramma]